MKFANAKWGTCERAAGLAKCGGAEGSRTTDILDRRIEMVAVDKLKPCKSNARVHSRKQIRQIADSIQRFAFINPILVDENGEVIGGHGRLEAAKLLGLAEVPTLRVSHLSAAEKRGYALTDNRLAELASWDQATLASELQALLDLSFEVELTGFDIGEVDIILNGAVESGGGIDPDDRPRPSRRPAISQRGDQWVLGAHRIVCGDAPDARAYAAIDAAIRRWQSCTGKKATYAGTGQTFAEVAKARANTTPADAARCPSVPADREAA
jgi:ParB-like chromosome segregation protein Spo0J